MALVTCRCGQVNRLPNVMNKPLQCGKCKRRFTPIELTKTTPEAPPSRMDGGLEFSDEPTYSCKDEDCGWEGDEEELEEDSHGKKTCPECGSRVKKLEQEADE